MESALHMFVMHLLRETLLALDMLHLALATGGLGLVLLAPCFGSLTVLLSKPVERESALVFASQSSIAPMVGWQR